MSCVLHALDPVGVTGTRIQVDGNPYMRGPYVCCERLAAILKSRYEDRTKQVSISITMKPQVASSGSRAKGCVEGERGRTGIELNPPASYLHYCCAFTRQLEMHVMRSCSWNIDGMRRGCGAERLKVL